MSNENTDTETTATTTAPKKAPERASKPKAEPKPAWEPSESVTAAMNAIAAIDHADKKGIAQIVKAAIDLRTGAKATRERAEVASDES